jgi:hypothetical protein
MDFDNAGGGAGGWYQPEFEVPLTRCYDDSGCRVADLRPAFSTEMVGQPLLRSNPNLNIIAGVENGTSFTNCSSGSNKWRSGSVRQYGLWLLPLQVRNASYVLYTESTPSLHIAYLRHTS